MADSVPGSATATGSRTVQGNVWLSLEPVASVAVTVTTKDPLSASPASGVPVIAPLLGSMLRPGGRPVSVQVSGEPLASVPDMGRETSPPSALDCASGSATETGLLIVQTKV